MKKLWVVLGLMVVLVFSGCSGSSKEAATKSESGYSTTTTTETATESEMSFSEDVEEQSDAAGSSAIYGGGSLHMGGTNESASDALANRKIIKEGYIYMETLEFEQTIADIKALMNMYGGYTSFSEMEGGTTFKETYQSRFATYVLKIPAENFDKVYDGLYSVGNIISSNDSVEDVTSTFTDIEARIKTLSIQEERLLSILERSEDVETIVELEYALQDVRYEIERYTSSLRNLEDKVRFSTIEIRIQEVQKVTIIEEPPVTMGERIRHGLNETFTEIKETIENIIVFLIVEFPTVIILGTIIFVFVYFIRKGMKKNLPEAKEIDASLSSPIELKDEVPNKDNQNDNQQ